MKVLIGLAIVALAGPAAARVVALDGDYGCSLLWHQAQRLRMMQLVMTNAEMKAQGRETAATRQEASKAAAELVRISNSDCKPLTGKFKILESRDVDGGNALRVEMPHGSYLWVLQ